MWNIGSRILRCSHLLALICAGAGVLSGCINQKIAGATNGDSGSPASRALSFLEGRSYDLGTVALGSTTLVRLSIVTTGTGDATIDSSSNSDSNFTFNGGTFPGTGGTCAQPIQGNCSIAILFTAGSVGLYSNTVTVSTTSAGVATSTQISLSASVTVSSILTINSGAAFGFGTKNIGTTTSQALTVTNSGGVTASSMVFSGLSAPITYLGGTYPGTGGTCGTALGASASCTVVVSYAPTVAATTNQTFAVSYSNGSGTVATNIAVSGTAISLASVAIAAPVANPSDYGNVVIGAPGVDLTVTLTNSGGQSATSLATSGLSAPITFKGGTYPGTGGTCTTSLAMGASCSMIVTFLPTTATTTSRSFGASYNDGSGTTQNLSRTILGTGQTPASLIVSDGATYDFGSRVTSTTGTKTFTVTNAGGATATAMAGAALVAPYAYKGGTYPGTAGTCGVSLAGAATCQIVVDFTPSAAGTFNSTLSLSHNTGVSVVSATRPMTGVGTLPLASVAITAPVTNPYSYGTVLVGAPGVDLTVTLSNTGGQPATSLLASGLGAPFTFKGGTYPGTGGNCGASLAASATCSMIITFLPSSSGFTTRTLTLSFNDGSGSTINLTRPIEGTGQTPASLVISDAPTYDFGSQVLATSTYHSFTVTNSGEATATAMSGAALAAPYSYRGGTYPGTGGTCGASLAGSGTCFVALAYTPSAVVTSNSTLTLNYNTGVSATTAARAITGTGINSPASLSITTPVADPYDYGTVTIGTPEVDLTITISNSGGQAATSILTNGLVAPFNFKGGAFPGTGGTCGVSLAAASTCNLILSFLPTSPGIYTSTLDVAYNDGTASTIHLTKAVRGTGGNASILTISDGPTYDFGSRAPSTTTDFTFTVSNSSGSPATAMAGAALSAPFSFKGGTYPGTGGSCGTSLGGSATCTFVLSFAPVASGGFTATAVIGYSNGVTTVSTSRNLSGTGGTVANLTISDGPTYDYSSLIKGYSATKMFTITNVGQSAATAMAGAALSAPYSYLGGAYPGTGGSCGTTLGAAGTCTVFIKYAPPAVGVSNSTFTLNYNNSVTTTSSPRALTGIGATATKIAGGANHTCALYSSGIVRCWGSNFYGQLGDASNTNAAVAVTVSGLTGATDLAVGSTHSCALSSGKVYCWGRDNNGQLGDDAALVNKNSATQVALYTDFTQVSAAGNVTCGLRSGGTIVCWGDDSEGANGNNVAFTNSTTPVTVSGLTTMLDVAVGRGHACGTRTGGTFRCWGSNTLGQLGNGGGANSGVPVTPVIVNPVSAVAGGDTSCAMISGGAVQCWGADDYGQLGNGLPQTSLSSPSVVAGLTNMTSLKFGLKHGCALDASSAAVCWGRDTSGQLGDSGAILDQPSPVAVSGMSSASKIGVGENHSCGALASGLVYCWGENSSGQLGDGSAPTNQATPVLVQGL